MQATIGPRAHALVLKLVVAMAAFACSNRAPMLAPVTIRLGPQGEILGWLASGPYPNLGALQLRGTGFATDYLAGETEAAPSEGLVVPMIPFEQATGPSERIARRPGWVLATGTPSGGVNLDALLDGGKPAVAYLYTTLISPDERDAEILFGSDDGAKVYVNGRLLFQKQIARSIKRDEDRVPIHLRAGANRVLFKIEHGNGPWGLLARLAASSGIEERLDVHLGSSGPSTVGEKWIRACAGKRGSLDLAAAIRYDALSLKAERWVQRFRVDARDPGRLDSALRDTAAALEKQTDPSALSRELEAADGSIQAAFDQARAPLLAVTQKALPLFRTNVATEDYAAVMPEGRYFVHADGRPLIPIGYNHNPDWPEFEESNPEAGDYHPERTEAYMAHLRESGVNMLRLMIETPQSGNLESPIGTFSPEHVRWIDTIVTSARKNGIKLIVTPWDTFWMTLRFDASSYNPALGGSMQHRIDFITSPVLRDQEKRRLKFLIDRWGNSGTVFSWELLNEADLWWGASPDQLRDWVTDMATYVRSYEGKKWGRTHLLSVSISEPMPKGALAEVAFDLPVLDYATTHLYIGASRAPTEPVGPAAAIHEGVTYCLAHLRDSRPYMDTENGPIDHWIDSEALDDRVFENMIWTHLASGAAGSGLRWPYRNPHHLTEGMLKSLKAMSEFVREAPWEKLSGERVLLSVTGQPGAATFGFGTAGAALVWTSGSGPVTVTWPGAPASLGMQVFDCGTGRRVAGGSLTRSEAGFVFSPPAGLTSFVALLTGSR